MQHKEDTLKRDKENFLAALFALEDALAQPYTDFMRDSVVKRFEITLEAAWKTLRSLLIFKDRIEENSPLKVIRAAFAQNYISEFIVWDNALELRNETVHAYGLSYGEKAYKFIKQNIAIFRDLKAILDQN